MTLVGWWTFSGDIDFYHKWLVLFMGALLRLFGDVVNANGEAESEDE